MSLVRSRLSRYLIWTGISVLLLCMLLLAGISTFLATETGSRYLVQQGVNQVNALPDLELSVGTVRGNLLLGLRLDDLAVTSPAANFAVRQLHAEWNPFSLFSGTLQLAELELETVTVVLPESDAGPDAGTANPLADFSFQALPLGIELGRLSLKDIRVDNAGQVTVIESLAAQVSLAGTDLRLGDLALDAEFLELDGQLNLKLSRGLPVDAQLDWRYPQPLLLDWRFAAGQLTLAGRIDDLGIVNTTTAPFASRSEGGLALFAEQGLEFQLQHSAPLIEFSTEGETWRFADLSLTTEGGLGGLNLSLAGQAGGSLLPDLSVNATGELAESVLSISQATAESAHGELQVSGIVDWTDGLQVSSDYELRDADPLALLQRELPFRLTDLASAGRVTLRNSEQGQLIELQLQRASALLDDFPLTAGGHLRVQEDEITIDNLLLESEANQLSVSGSYGADAGADLRWRLQAPVLEQFLPGVAAAASGSGYLRGELATPQIEADIDVTALQTSAASADRVQLQVSGDDAAGYQGTVRLRNGVVAGQELSISSAEMDFAGTRAAHTGELQIESNRGAAELRLSGGFTEAAGSNWAGRLATAQIQGDVGDWRLQSAVDLGFQDNLVSVDNSCWSYAQIEVCVSVIAAGAGQQQLEATVNRFPLAEFNSLSEREPLFNLVQLPRLPDDVDLTGTVSGQISAEFGAAGEPRATASISADNALLTLRSTADDVFGAEISEAEIIEQRFRWSRLSMRAELEQGRWDIGAQAQLNAENIRDSSLGLNGNLEASLAIDSQGGLSGSSSAEFADLGWITAFVPELRNVSGELTSTLSIGGTLQQPRVTGDLNVNRGSFLIDRAGVTYSDLELHLSSMNFNSASLEGSVGAGEGSVEFAGTAENLNSDNWHVAADLQGQEFPLAYLPDLVLEVSPTLTLDANPSRIALQGQLQVPLLDLTLRQLPESAVDISRDVVITDYPEDRPELAMTYTASQMSVLDTPVSADVEIVLGEEITLRGFGLEAGLAGSLDIQQEADGTNLTYGELEVTDGRYRIYGQELTLQNGKLQFFGNYNNPALDIRAVREVDDLTVGVLMSGTLNNISSELFSTPSLPESDILAVLVTGRQFGDSQSTADGDAMLSAIARLGIKQSEGLTEEIGTRFGLDTIAITNTGDIDSSTLTIGKYLTPKVFVRYGVGLFDSISKLAVDYIINDRLTLQAESGQYQSIDFTYRVER